MREALSAKTGRLETNRTEKLEYVHAMLGQLRQMTADEGHEMLTYLLEMACTEANDVLRGAPPSRVGRSPRHSRGGRNQRDSAS